MIVFCVSNLLSQRSRDGLVGYDAALTRLRSGVRLPLLVHAYLLEFLVAFYSRVGPHACRTYSVPFGHLQPYTEEPHSVGLMLIEPRPCPYSFVDDAFVENFQLAIILHSIL